MYWKRHFNSVKNKFKLVKHIEQNREKLKNSILKLMLTSAKYAFN